jgi:FAD/FMN-containing dehydrogenase
MNLQGLAEKLFFIDETMRTLYATDASIIEPLAVAIPSTKQDIQKIINLQRP